MVESIDVSIKKNPLPHVYLIFLQKI